MNPFGFKKIDFSQIEQKASTQQSVQGAQTPTQQEEKGRTVKKYILIGVILMLVAVILLGYRAAASFIVWDDDGSNSSTVSADAFTFVAATPEPIERTVTEEVANETATNPAVKGKLTISFVKENNKPYVGGTILLTNSSGKVIRSEQIGSTGTLIADELPAGTYTIKGFKEGDSRSVVKSVSLGAGEIKSVTTGLYIDTPVTITVTVKKSDGSPAAGESFNLVRVRTVDGDEIIPVTANENGTFTARKIYPNDQWKLVQNDVTVATINVAPTGVNQTFNVTINSN